MYPSLFASNTTQGKKVMGTFTEQPSILGTKPQEPEMFSTERLNALVNQQEQLFGKLQGLFDHLETARNNLAMEKMQVAQREQIDPNDAMQMFGAAMAAKFLGARDQYVQGALQNTLKVKNEQLDQQYLEQNLQNQEDFRQQQAMGQAGLQNIADDINSVQGQIGNTQKEIQYAYDAYETELREAGLDRRAMLTYNRMVTVQQMKIDATQAITEYKDNPAERLRFMSAAEEILRRQAEAQLGRALNPDEEKQIVEQAATMALSDKYLEHAKQLGVEADTALTAAKTETENQTRPWKVKLEEAKVATEEARPGLMQSQANANNARASLYEATEQFLGPKFDLEVWKKLYDAEESGTPVGEDLKKDALAQISEIDKGINSLESEIQMLRRQRIGADDDEKAEIDALISEYRQDIKDAKQLREGHQFTLDFVNKQPKPVSEKPTPPKAPAPKSGASSDLHSSKRQDLIDKFGVRVDHWSEPRKMRGGGGTGMSRHGSGRAIDVFYGSKKDEVLKYLQDNGAKLIIDYVGQRTWVRGRGWKANKNLDKSHKHFHVEYD